MSLVLLATGRVARKTGRFVCFEPRGPGSLWAKSGNRGTGSRPQKCLKNVPKDVRGWHIPKYPLLHQIRTLNFKLEKHTFAGKIMQKKSWRRNQRV